jgi:hypothetical protein
MRLKPFVCSERPQKGPSPLAERSGKGPQAHCQDCRIARDAEIEGALGTGDPCWRKAFSNLSRRFQRTERTKRNSILKTSIFAAHSPQEEEFFYNRRKGAFVARKSFEVEEYGQHAKKE